MKFLKNKLSIAAYINQRYISMLHDPGVRASGPGHRQRPRLRKQPRLTPEAAGH